MAKQNAIVDLTVEFAQQIIQYCELLEKGKKWVLANQLLKSGTSIGANVWEAQHADSRVDFIHKMKIAAKEAHETAYWLLLCEKSETYPNCNELKIKLDSIQKVLTKIIVSSKKKTISKSAH
ncbi:MAG: four helix bundle protein [Chitinophagales bacterium]|nr:four helix bundle protein [Chitinophagales bacterium]